jgi:hypothetical protein
VAERITFWSFYFDDLGAEVGEHLGAVRAGDFGRPLDNTHPSQRVHRAALFREVVGASALLAPMSTHTNVKSSR